MMSSHKRILEAVYSAKTPRESRMAYDTWSGSYDADNLAKGFRLPALGAGLLSRHMGMVDGPILDAGCGTGLAGESLALLGLGPITGCDLSPEMIKQARRTAAYAEFDEADMGAGLPFANGTFAGFICVGSFGPGHAPPSTLEHLVRVTRPGGYGVFNLIEATYEDQGFGELIARLCADQKWEVVHVTPPFLPFLLGEPDLWSRAYAVRVL